MKKMKPRLHSKTKNILMILTDGSTYHSKLKRVIYSRLGLWALSLDTQSHPFWQRREEWDSHFIDISSQRTKFQKKYNLPKSLKNKK
jgi:ribosomal protein L31